MFFIVKLVSKQVFAKRPLAYPKVLIGAFEKNFNVDKVAYLAMGFYLMWECPSHHKALSLFLSQL